MAPLNRRRFMKALAGIPLAAAAAAAAQAKQSLSFHRDDRLSPGDRFTIDGVYEVNPEGRAMKLKGWVVEDVQVDDGEVWPIPLEAQHGVTFTM